MNIELVYNPYSREVRLFREGKETVRLPKPKDGGEREEREIGKDDAIPNGAEDAFVDYYPNGGMEFADWAAAFFDKLHGKYDTGVYSVTFRGIERDVESLEDAAEKFKKEHRDVQVTLNTQVTAADDEKLERLKKLFENMSATVPNTKSFARLRESLGENGTITANFNKLMSSDFEMAVVATMSSGKSTLINAMLGQEILPAANAATTATIARIHDIDGQTTFNAVAVDENKNVVGKFNPLTLKDMNGLNGDGTVEHPPKARYIDIYGDIEGISNSVLRLVVIDTPGPNNSQSKEHGETTQNILTADYKPMVLYVLNGTQLGINDDDSLLRDVAQQMNSGGRQSKDRFIFVLNKADAFDPEKGESVERVIESCRAYLAKHGINDAKIFPCASRMAKVIRQHLGGHHITETEEDEILPGYRSFIKHDWKHFNNFAPLSPVQKRKQDMMIEEARADTSEEGGYKEALIYTGIPAVELAMDEYLNKYAVPAKVREGVDSFKATIDALGVEATATAELQGNEKAVEEKAEQIRTIQAALKSGEKKDEVAQKIESISVKDKFASSFKSSMADTIQQFQAFTQSKRKKVSPETAQANIETVNMRLNDIQMKLKVKIEKTLNDALASQCRACADEYNRYLKDLAGEAKMDTPSAVLGDLGSITVEDSLSDYTSTSSEEVLVGHHTERNSERRGWGILAFWKPWNVEVDDYETVTKEEVDFADFIDEVIMPKFSDVLMSMQSMATDVADKQEKSFKKYFKEKLAELDQKIRDKLAEQEAALSDKEKLDAMIEENKKNLKWLGELKESLDGILAI